MSIVISLARKFRVRSIVWFGRISYRKMKVTYEIRKILCPLCKHELEDARYFGSKVFQFDPSKTDYIAKGWLPLVEDGLVVWVVSNRG
jgi:hypothetical protein